MKSPLNPSNEPGIPEDYYNELITMVKSNKIPLNTQFGILYLGLNEDRDEWQALRLDTLPYSADLLEYTLKVLQAGENMDLPHMDSDNPLLEAVIDLGNGTEAEN